MFKKTPIPKINIVYPRGCYGTYLAQCLYLYSNLNNKKSIALTINYETGSSHDFNEDIIEKHFHRMHLTDLVPFSDYLFNESIVILPDKNNQLDYIDNQFIKRESADIIKFIKMRIELDVIYTKLKENWNLTHAFDGSVPKWILREFISLWLRDSLNLSYNRDLYISFPAKTYVNINDFFDSTSTIHTEIIKSLGLQLIAKEKNIKENTLNWANQQKFHNIQSRCEEWIQSVIFEKENIKNPCLTLIDEAYIQMRLREQGYEIKCDGLNYLPSNSEKMSKLLC